jgi:hypothetical protein
VVVWSENGIEYLYPREILERKYGSFAKLDMGGDVIEANGISAKKRELADYVAAQMSGSEALSDELTAKLLTPIRNLLA